MYPLNSVVCNMNKSLLSCVCVCVYVWRVCVCVCGVCVCVCVCVHTFLKSRVESFFDCVQ